MQIGLSTGVCFSNPYPNDRLALTVGRSCYLIMDYHITSQWSNIFFIHYFLHRPNRSDGSSNIEHRKKTFKTNRLAMNAYTIF